MSEIFAAIAALRRPRLLIRAARLGVQDYRRERDLRRLLGAQGPSHPEDRLAALLAAEDTVEAARREGLAGYNPTRHVALLIALVAEGQLARGQLTRGPQSAALPAI